MEIFKVIHEENNPNTKQIKLLSVLQNFSNLNEPHCEKHNICC